MAATVQVTANESRAEALALHRSGALDRAEAIYNTLLEASPDDPDVLGLLGALELQRGRLEDGEDLLRRSLQSPQADPGLHLRNLNNLFVALRGQGRDQSARDLAATDLPDWPADLRPDETQSGQAASLAEALGLFGRSERGAGLLERMASAAGGDAGMWLLAGRLRLKSGDPAAAIVPLRKACACDPSDWQAPAMLSAAHCALGDDAGAAEATALSLRAAPVYFAPAVKGQAATILCLNNAPRRIKTPEAGLHGLHFKTNYISQISHILDAEYRFGSVFLNLPHDPSALSDVDVVFNNIASGEEMSLPGWLEQAEDLIARIGRPVINHPRAVLQMTRQKAADLLRPIAGLRVPHIGRYWRDMGSIAEIEADIAASFTYPVIVRHVAADSSSKSLVAENKTAFLAKNFGELRRFLESINWPQFYVIQFVEMCRPDGVRRKLRAAFFPDEIIMIHVLFHNEWSVGGRAGQAANFFNENPPLVEEMHRVLADPWRFLGSHVPPLLEAVRAAVPLDVFGMDFDIDEDGQIVPFETQATMEFLPPPSTPKHLITPENDARVNDAFRRLVRARMAGSS
jgi:Flp pilus assembly protein TadD